jgi:hypothetical protein
MEQPITTLDFRVPLPQAHAWWRHLGDLKDEWCMQTYLLINKQAFKRDNLRATSHMSQEPLP